MANGALLYSLLHPLVGVALRWYYRSITVTGLERIPESGPVFIAANHPNALVDALVVGCVVPRRVRFTAKATIFSNPLGARLLTRIGVVPLRRASDERSETPSDGQPDPARPDPARNAASFDAVADALAEGAAIVIFPEGRSHDDPHLAPLRTGLARMAWHAADARGVRELRIVPVGLLFEQKERPRSRILVRVGEPLVVDALRLQGANIASLTQLVSERLNAVTLNFSSPEDAERLQIVGRTLAALLEPTRAIGEDTTPLSAVLRVVQRLDRAQQALRAKADPALDARAAAFEQRVRNFRATLDAQHLDPHDVAIDVHATPGVRFAIREATLAALLAPVGLWGRITHTVPIQLTRMIALRNVRSRDEPAMRTLVLGFVVVLIAYALETTLVAALFGGWWALAFLISLIPAASSDLRYGDRTRRARARARAYFTFRRNPALQQQLLAEGEAIRHTAGELERLSLAT
ncbi:MAG: 1-acyl-sn-glycerol-3-phosphate acyltransferase [Gemmatimonadaceae bacterium]|nr:1-acyl-sn-glycerol-3-phosphate acyltransferase [Gemmatimonadaceae bacterium]